MTTAPPRLGNLTSMEILALRQGLNLSDAHPRMPLTARQREVVGRLGEMFDEAGKRPFNVVEEEAQAAFLHGIGQLEAPVGTGRLLSCYSSSVAMDITARALAERVSRVALIHPTFDNIPDLLRARGLQLVPVAEAALDRRELDLPADVGAVFVTTPNNPTGWVLPEAGLRWLAEECAAAGRILALDTCFRAQDPRAQYDTYRVLDRSGVQWVVIEDTGKLWPTCELKVGFLAWGATADLSIADAFSDVLLSISPLVLLLVTALARDGVDGGYADLHRLVRDNRDILARALRPTPLTLVDPDSRISVARVGLPPGATGQQAYRWLAGRNVHMLPCAPFHWARPVEGEAYLRMSLARSSLEVEAAALVLTELARELDEPRSGA